MDCADEVAILEKVLGSLAGVREVRPNLIGAKLTVVHDGRIEVAPGGATTF